ncbi:hypothetical protein C1631_007280 [Chryseobacterium phosphatilyticum]|uniref:Uncharacterized protein n=1 Tax=Chryseobacterium phosphatilyticum TaxID=475075 RepID=A0A316X7S6_9FLAO|nr:hypothetical protein C1631_007280 [Chryseobacterium phosphatilyticum]
MDINPRNNSVHFYCNITGWICNRFDRGIIQPKGSIGSTCNNRIPSFSRSCKS